MILLLPLLLLAVLVWLWLDRRGSTLSRACRWRLDRALGPSMQRCATCGAICDPGPGRRARQCLNPRGTE